MIKENLNTIKERIKEIKDNRKLVKAIFKEEFNKLEKEKKHMINEYKKEYKNNEFYLDHMIRTAENIYQKKVSQMCNNTINNYSCEAGIYLIYKDGTDAYVLEDDLLTGYDEFPKITNIAYAEYSDGYEHYDTETGELDWYSDERMEQCDYEYEIEDENKFQYEMSIQCKFHTEYSEKYMIDNPNFVPIVK